MLILKLKEAVTLESYFVVQTEAITEAIIDELSHQKLSLIGFPKSSEKFMDNLPEPVYSAKDCQLKEVLGEKSEAIYHTCYSEGGVSGGPVFYQKEDGTAVIIGVLSFGNANPEKPLGVAVTTFGLENSLWLTSIPSL